MKNEIEKIREGAAKIGARVNEDYQGQIGIQYKGTHVWHWFKIYSEDFVAFDHSYSMNTGRSKKGIRHGMKIKSRLGMYD